MNDLCKCICHSEGLWLGTCTCTCFGYTDTTTTSTTDWKLWSPQNEDTILSDTFNTIYIIKNTFNKIIGWTKSLEVRQKWIDLGYKAETINKIDSPPEITLYEEHLKDIYNFMKQVNIVNDKKGVYINLMELLENYLSIGEDEVLEFEEKECSDPECCGEEND